MVIDELTTNGTKFLNDAMINSAGIYVVNCWAGIDYINREIVIRPVSLLRQLVYFIKFSYLFEPIILDEEYTAIHRVIRYFKIKLKPFCKE